MNSLSNWSDGVVGYHISLTKTHALVCDRSLPEKVPGSSPCPTMFFVFLFVSIGDTCIQLFFLFVLERETHPACYTKVVVWNSI